MTRLMLCVFYVLSAGLCFGPGVVFAMDLPHDLASGVRAIFKVRCAGCHGADLAKPRGRFGYVLDLGRVASNPEMVVPSFPNESELWELVRRGEMPPDDSPTGPLSREEKELIQAWIAAGAPADTRPPAEQDASQADPLAPAPSIEKSVLHLLGPFHLVVVHFPIALLIAAAVAEFGGAPHGSRIPSACGSFLCFVWRGQCGHRRGARLDSCGQWARRRSAEHTPHAPLDRHRGGRVGHCHRLLS